MAVVFTFITLSINHFTHQLVFQFSWCLCLSLSVTNTLTCCNTTVWEARMNNFLVSVRWVLDWKKFTLTVIQKAEGRSHPAHEAFSGLWMHPSGFCWSCFHVSAAQRHWGAGLQGSRSAGCRRGTAVLDGPCFWRLWGESSRSYCWSETGPVVGEGINNTIHAVLDGAVVQFGGRVL